MDSILSVTCIPGYLSLSCETTENIQSFVHSGVIMQWKSAVNN